MTQLVKRHRELPKTLTDDQLALLYAIYAMGYLRQITYACAAGSDRILVAGEALLPLDPAVERLDAAYFRHAVELVKTPTTVTALQTHIVLQLYCMACASMRTTRQIVGKLCYCVNELGLLHSVSSTACRLPQSLNLTHSACSQLPPHTRPKAGRRRSASTSFSPTSAGPA